MSRRLPEEFMQLEGREGARLGAARGGGLSGGWGETRAERVLRRI